MMPINVGSYRRGTVNISGTHLDSELRELLIKANDSLEKALLQQQVEEKIKRRNKILKEILEDEKGI
jgi:hypothetical protein